MATIHISEKGYPSPLEISLKLFGELENRGVKHCHWKSNQHLDAALAGLTDIDMFVAKEHATICHGILAEMGFKRFISPPWKTYPGIEDYLGFDDESGGLVHLHLHYELNVGPPYVKGYRIPLEKVILETAVFDERFRVRIIEPNIELMLLWIRSSLKIRLGDAIKTLKGNIALPKDIQKEFSYLENRISPDVVHERTAKLFGADVGQHVYTIMSTKNCANLISLVQFRRCTRKIVNQWRMYTIPSMILLYNWRKLSKAITNLGFDFIKIPTWKGKRCHSGGLLIALIGADGSGKSTVTSALQHWLSWKIDVHRFYLGSGEGSVNFIFGMRGLGRKLVSIFRRNKAGVRGDQSIKDKNQKECFLRDLFDGITYLSLAKAKYAKIQLALRLKAKGAVVITDRYPQNEFPGISDGVKINKGSEDSQIRSYFSNKEINIYRKMANMAPDLVVKLIISPEVALERKPDHLLSEIEQKVAVVNSLHFLDAKIISIDASASLEEVLLEVKRAIWQML